MRSVDLHQYRENRQKLLDQTPKYRELCTTCLQPGFGCYCSHVQRFDPLINFVVLIHPIEVKRRIATGRMSHLCLKDSHLIMGQNYSDNDDVNKLIEDSDFHSVILYPGVKSKNLTPMSETERKELFPANKKLRIFVIDGTWATAKKMVRQSENLSALPRICFSPEKPSTFRVRKQPNPACYSTIEAIHHTIELVGQSQGFNTEGREHDKLLHVFDSMVERQLEFIRKAEEKPDYLRYRRDRKRSA
ncbi:tRNA-uridine aminocarboxypropyltransferase [Bdellovibrio bacteriovorus]|uniref:tRNA-uridine aminocarboxypropyltransferase n=1 Tax=Bdellovibrio bacteriovorus TaxID=959 RepID=UPI0035A83629